MPSPRFSPLPVLRDSNNGSVTLENMSRQIIPETELLLLVAARDLLIRVGLSSLLEERGCAVLAQTDDAALNDDIDRFQPDILVVDMGWHSQAMRRNLSEVESDLPVLALVADDEADEAASLLPSLAAFTHCGLLLRNSEPDIIVAALHALDSGLVVIDPTLRQLLQTPIHPPPSPLAVTLTRRENEVLQWLAQGLTNRAIAFELGITQHTVKFHVNAIMSKLDAQSRTEAVVRATQAGMIVL